MKEEIRTHTPPCDTVKSLRNWMIGALTIQTTFVMGSLMICMNTHNTISAVVEKQVQVIERQKFLESKTDLAAKHSSEALTLSSRTDADIQWIRSGLTELKAELRILGGTK